MAVINYTKSPSFCETGDEIGGGGGGGGGGGSGERLNVFPIY